MSYETFGAIGLRVLVVDSHEDSLLLARLILECVYANVLAVTSAVHALPALRYFQPELLISELYLPEIDGYTLMQQVHHDLARQNRQIPAIALTTQVSAEAQARALAVGYWRYIAKPYQAETLLETVAQLSPTRALLWNGCCCCV